MIAYHLRPSVFPGGFVGVDVFFVISGYLIIGSLYREAIRTGTVRLADFYARRIRRLLPASTVVIVVTLAGSLLLLPPSRWRGIGIDAITSALQVQNWALAFGPSEYAQATAGVSPYQHFWSLAVEEQFYLLIPLLILLSGRLGRPRIAPPVAIGLLFTASLAWSIFITPTEHQVSYFATTTRMWELALGGLVAILLPAVRLPRGWRAAVAGSGLAAIAASCALLSTSMAFPGWIALPATVGTALVILAGQHQEHSILGWRPVAYIGDISYSLYLWHWPVILAGIVLTGGQLSLPTAAAAGVVSLTLAAGSERWIERPFRHRRAASDPQRGATRSPRGLAVTFLSAAAAITVSVSAGLGPVLWYQARTAEVATVSGASADYPGAEVFAGAPEPPERPILPDPLAAGTDFSLVNRDRCIEVDITIPDPRLGPETCRYGPPGAAASIVLVGDSHAAVLSTPLAQLADARGIRLTALVRNGCPFNSSPLSKEGVTFTDCVERNQHNLELILRERPSLVVTTAMSADGYRSALDWSWKNNEAEAAGYRDVMGRLASAGIPVLVIADWPFPPFNAPDCVQQHGRGPGCDFPRPRSSGDASLTDAASEIPNVSLANPLDRLCRPDQCRSVEGNVLVYRDNHLTDTYARTLTGWLDEQVDPFLRR